MLRCRRESELETLGWREKTTKECFRVPRQVLHRGTVVDHLAIGPVKSKIWSSVTIHHLKPRVRPFQFGAEHFGVGPTRRLVVSLQMVHKLTLVTELQRGGGSCAKKLQVPLALEHLKVSEGVSGARIGGCIDCFSPGEVMKPMNQVLV